jgi:hypothetical protein
MLTIIAPIFAAFFFRSGLTMPYPFTNTTTPSNATSPNTTMSLPTNGTVPQYECENIYPSDLTVVNQRYPDYNITRLHTVQSYFMLRREVGTDGEIATVVHFEGLPSNSSNTTCRLEFILPAIDTQTISGFNPTFNVYQVELEPNSIATWNTYASNADAPLFGTVNGEPEALEKTRSVGGVAAISESRCNYTMTFQVGMAFDSRDGLPNYWEFPQVSLPAWPEQGFRMVYGC